MANKISEYQVRKQDFKANKQELVNLLTALENDKRTVNNFLYTLGALNAATLKSDKNAKDIIFNEITKRYWIVKLNFGSGETNSLYFSMPKPIIANLKAIETNEIKNTEYAATPALSLDEFRALTESKPLSAYGKETDEIIFNWTLKHQWQIISEETIDKILVDIANERGFYFRSYLNILHELKKKEKRYKLESDDNSDFPSGFKLRYTDDSVDSHSESYANAYVEAILSDANYIVGQIEHYSAIINPDKKRNKNKKDENAEKLNKEDEKRSSKKRDLDNAILSVLYWLYYLVNLKSLNFSNDDLAELKDALVKKPNASYSYETLNADIEQYQIKGFDYQTIINRLITDKENLIYIQNYWGNKDYKSTLERFALLLDASLKTTEKLTAKTLYWNLFLSNNAQKPAWKTENEFYVELKVDLDNVLKNKDYKKAYADFYIKYLSTQDIDLLNALTQSANAESQALIDISSKKSFTETHNFFIEFVKTIDEDIENKAAIIVTAERNENWARVSEVKKEREELIATREERIERYRWISTARQSILYAAADIEKLVNSTDSLRIYPQYITKAHTFILNYETLNDILPNYSSPQLVESLRFNFSPTRVKNDVDSYITCFDPTIDLSNLKALNGNIRLYNGLDTELINAKIVYLLKTAYSEYKEGSEITYWKPEHKGWISVLQFYFQILSLTNEKLVWNPADWKQGLRENTIDLYARSLLQYFLFHKLKTGYLLLLGDGNDGKSDTKHDLQKALGTSYYCLAKSVEKDKFTDGFRVNARAEFYDDNGPDQIDSIINEIKAETTINNTLNYEIKNDKNRYTRPSAISIMIILNDLPKNLLSDYSVVRRITIFKAASQQDRKSNGIQQDALFKLDAEKARYYFPVIFNTYQRNAMYRDEFEPRNIDLFDDTKKTEEHKTLLGTSVEEKFLISTIMSTLSARNSSEDKRREQPVIRYQKEYYYGFMYPINDLYEEYVKWDIIRNSNNKKFIMSFDTFNKRLEKSFSKKLWSDNFGAVLPRKFKKTDVNEFESENNLYLLLPIKQINELKTFALDNKCGATRIPESGSDNKLAPYIWKNADFPTKNLENEYAYLTYKEYEEIVGSVREKVNEKQPYNTLAEFDFTKTLELEPGNLTPDEKFDYVLTKIQKLRNQLSDEELDALLEKIDKNANDFGAEKNVRYKTKNEGGSGEGGVGGSESGVGGSESGANNVNGSTNASASTSAASSTNNSNLSADSIKNTERKENSAEKTNDEEPDWMKIDEGDETSEDKSTDKETFTYPTAAEIRKENEIKRTLNVENFEDDSLNTKAIKKEYDDSVGDSANSEENSAFNKNDFL